MTGTRCPNHQNRAAVKRGLCVRCYATMHARVRRGISTWEQLEAAGLVGTRGKRGRPIKDFKRVTG